MKNPGVSSYYAFFRLCFQACSFHSENLLHPFHDTQLLCRLKLKWTFSFLNSSAFIYFQFTPNGKTNSVFDEPDKVIHNGMDFCGALYFCCVFRKSLSILSKKIKVQVYQVTHYFKQVILSKMVKYKIPSTTLLILITLVIKTKM